MGWTTPLSPSHVIYWNVTRPEQQNWRRLLCRPDYQAVQLIHLFSS
jgi:hypothetical protein